MAKRRPDTTSAFVSLLFSLAGLGMLAGCVGITASLGQVTLALQRTPAGIEGSIDWKFAGVPVFWRSLDGLATVVRDDYETREEKRGGSSPIKTVAQLVFLDREQRQLAWATRTAVINEIEAIERFLQPAPAESPSDIASYHYQEPTPAWSSARLQEWGIVLVFVPLLLLGGMLCLLVGVLTLWRRLVPGPQRRLDLSQMKPTRRKARLEVTRAR